MVRAVGQNFGASAAGHASTCTCTNVMAVSCAGCAAPATIIAHAMPIVFEAVQHLHASPSCAGQLLGAEPWPAPLPLRPRHNTGKGEVRPTVAVDSGGGKRGFVLVWRACLATSYEARGGANDDDRRRTLFCGSVWPASRCV